MFGQSGTGGYAAVWLGRQDEDLADQSIVFLGSEGETAVVARHLAHCGHSPVRQQATELTPA
ncbi:hypothetical protein [Streptomyces violascens]|uniref:hypothetical protein n=1 Tax=Streptomyces violascens TaxID=67381 RepID=UPI003690FD2D